MIFETALNIGDKGWVYNGTNGVEQLTIGKITIEHTDSTGCGWMSFGDNYKPQKSHAEKYMCEETGISGGSVYTLNEHIFTTEEAAREAFAECIAKSEAQKKARQERDRQEKLSRESYLRSQLAEIDRIKAERE